MKPRMFDESALIIKDGRARVRSGVAGNTPDIIHQESAGSSPASSPYRSKWEQSYAQRLALELKAGAIKAFWYEPFSFKLASGKRYRVDFMVWTEAGIECIEVKGHHKNMRDSLTHLKWAAQKFPCFTWRKVWWEKGGWDGTYIVA